MLRRSCAKILGFIATASLVAASCSSGGGGNSANAASSCEDVGGSPVITFAAYSTPREVYGKIISAFQAFVSIL